MDFTRLKLLVLDVDGVLTDGRIIYSAYPEGDVHETKFFNVRDGAGLKYWVRAGGQLAWITGRGGRAVEHRADELDVACLKQGAKQKLPAFEEVLNELNASPEETVVMGDDLPDLPLLRQAGFAACPSDAADDVKAVCHHVCQLPGGGGCVREVVELVLKNAGRWDAIMARYR